MTSVVTQFNQDPNIVTHCKRLCRSETDWAKKTLRQAIKMAITNVRNGLKAEEVLVASKVVEVAEDPVLKHLLFLPVAGGKANGTFLECVPEAFNHKRCISQMMAGSQRACVENWNEIYDKFIVETRDERFAFKGDRKTGRW